MPVDSFAAPVQPKPAPFEPEETKTEPDPEPAPEPKEPAAPVELPVQEDARALTLADLACTLLSILFAALVWLRGKKTAGKMLTMKMSRLNAWIKKRKKMSRGVTLCRKP